MIITQFVIPFLPIEWANNTALLKWALRQSDLKRKEGKREEGGREKEEKEDEEKKKKALWSQKFSFVVALRN